MNRIIVALASALLVAWLLGVDRLVPVVELVGGISDIGAIVDEIWRTQ